MEELKKKYLELTAKLQLKEYYLRKIIYDEDTEQFIQQVLVEKLNEVQEKKRIHDVPQRTQRSVGR